jgi:hypothetical protein
MSTSEKSQEGEMVCVKVRSVKEILARQIPKAVALQHALVYAGKVNRIMVAPEVHPRAFGMLLACTIAVGADLGPFAKGPGAKVFYVSGSGDGEADADRLKMITGSFDPDQQVKLDGLFKMYNRADEEDDQINLTTENGRAVLMKSTPTDTKVIVLDYLPGFFPTPNIHHKQRKEVDSWLDDVSKKDVTVVVFDVVTKKCPVLGEHLAKNTIYLEHDETAPTQFGGGHLLRRSRVDDADSTPKCVSFWYTKVDGKLAYGFSVPDDEDRNTPYLTKKLERQIKVALMREANMPQKAIADELQVHAATICRDFKEMDMEAARAAKVMAPLSEM